jgi:purine/pyrimidine-nucleoside phosphorylase
MSSFPNVTVDAKANVYFDGRVVSHTVHFADGSRKTLGLIYPGSYHFGTAAPERMEIIAGSCHIKQDADDTEADVDAGSYFDVPGNSGFTIEVANGICEYICSFLDA